MTVEGGRNPQRKKKKVEEWMEEKDERKRNKC
jgi:hypothetical protein